MTWFSGNELFYELSRNITAPKPRDWL